MEKLVSVVSENHVAKTGRKYMFQKKYLIKETNKIFWKDKHMDIEGWKIKINKWIDSKNINLDNKMFYVVAGTEKSKYLKSSTDFVITNVGPWESQFP